jgi:hypothetical protein
MRQRAKPILAPVTKPRQREGRSWQTKCRGAAVQVQDAMRQPEYREIQAL